MAARSAYLICRLSTSSPLSRVVLGIDSTDFGFSILARSSKSHPFLHILPVVLYRSNRFVQDHVRLNFFDVLFVITLLLQSFGCLIVEFLLIPVLAIYKLVNKRNTYSTLICKGFSSCLWH